MLCLGDVNAGSTVRLPFNTNAIAGESITIGTNGTIAIYKEGSTTERSSSSGVTFTEDHDGHTGSHVIAIDLSDNADAGFYAAGSFYMVKYHTATIDGKAVSAWVGCFSIDKTYQYADGRKWLGTTVATPTVAGVPEVDLTHAFGSALAAGGLTDLGAAYAADNVVPANVEAIADNVAAAAQLAKSMAVVGSGVVDTGATTTSIPTSLVVPTVIEADQYKGRVIIFNADTATTALRGQQCEISSHTSGGVFSVTTLTESPASGDAFGIY